MATVYVPTPLRRLTGGEAKVEARGGDISELLGNLDKEYPGIRDRVCEAGGEVKPYVNVFLNGKEIRTLEGNRTLVAQEDEVHIIPAMAGGGQPLVCPTAGRRLPSLGRGPGEGP